MPKRSRDYYIISNYKKKKRRIRKKSNNNVPMLGVEEELYDKIFRVSENNEILVKSTWLARTGCHRTANGAIIMGAEPRVKWDLILNSGISNDTIHKVKEELEKKYNRRLAIS